YEKTFKHIFPVYNMEKSWFNPKKIVGFFAVVLLVTGFFLLDKGISGNVILDGGYTLNPLSLIGLIIVLCAAVLTVYVIKKDNRK
ncbi:MAG: hypothetical protein ABIH65_03540, partial [Nanoarchaeota archaeon]